MESDNAAAPFLSPDLKIGALLFVPDLPNYIRERAKIYDKIDYFNINIDYYA